jgi:hypothetical protein
VRSGHETQRKNGEKSEKEDTKLCEITIINKKTKLTRKRTRKKSKIVLDLKEPNF